MITPRLVISAAIPIVEVIEMFLSRVGPEGRQGLLHDAHLLTCTGIFVHEAGRSCRLRKNVPLIMQLFHQSVHAPTRVSVGYRVAQNLDKSGLGSFGGRLLVCNAAFNAVRVYDALRAFPGWLQLAKAAGCFAGTSIGDVEARLLGRRALAATSAPARCGLRSTRTAATLVGPAAELVAELAGVEVGFGYQTCGV
jgi:hypothetical protein